MTKRILLLISFSLLHVSGNAKLLHMYKGEYYDHGHLVRRDGESGGTPYPLEYTYYTDRHGERVRHGIWRVYNRHGKPWLERVYHHGRTTSFRQYTGGEKHMLLMHQWTRGSHREEMLYWRSGNPRKYNVFLNGAYHGFQYYWHESGNMQRKVRYKNGARHGMEHEYTENGHIQREREWSNGSPHNGDFILVYRTVVREATELNTAVNDDVKTENASQDQADSDRRIIRYRDGVPMIPEITETTEVNVTYIDGMPQAPLPDVEPNYVR